MSFADPHLLPVLLCWVLCVQLVQLAVCAAIHNISVGPVGRERVIANQGILRIFRSMDLHIDVRGALQPRPAHTACVIFGG